MSQKRFGSKIGKTGKCISAYETGRSNPSMKILERISDVYDVSFVSIKDRKKEMLIEKMKELKESLSEIEDILVKN